MIDSRIVYGARCTWWAPITDLSVRPGLPLCPECGSPLFESPTPEQWWAGVDKHSRSARDPQYRTFVEWLRGKCFRSHMKARHVFDNREETHDA